MLFSPMKIGKVEIKNRVVMPPMMLGMGQFNGNANEKMMNYYEERAKGGVGLIITEITRVNDSTGASTFNQLGASKDRNIAPMAELAKRIHKHGAKLFVQLHHPGRQNVSLMINTLPISVLCDKIMPNDSYSKLLYGHIVPIGKKMAEKNLLFKTVSPSKCEISKCAESQNKALTKTQIKKLINQFADAAVRVKKAGCDGVELHAAHGYLIQQFLSPFTNRRTDEYGGSLENRMRFLTEIIDLIREKCGADFPIIVRLSVDEMYEKIGQKGRGYTLEDGIKMAKILEAKGIDAIDVSSASYDTFNYWLEPTTFECGWRKNLAAEIKKNVNIPVIAANLIRSPKQAEEQLESGIQDFVALGRPHIADPHWTEKVAQGREDEIKRCVCCLYCFESMMRGAYEGKNAQCSVNPFVGREDVKLKENGADRKVIIVGAGPAGLTCAELLAKRKFDVTVLEKEDYAGGQLNLADKPPHKEKIHWVADDLLVNAKKAGAKVLFKTNATADVISSFNPEFVIVATGGSAVHPKAFSGDNVVTVTEILNGTIKPDSKNVCVIGSGMTGLETAELLCEQGNKVSIVEMANEIAPDTWFQHKDDALPKLNAHGVKFYTSTKLLSVNENSTTVCDLNANKEFEIPCDLVVLSLGVKPNNSLYEELKGMYKNLYLVGDASKIGRIFNATENAYQTVMSIN